MLDVESFHARGLTVLRGFFDARALAEEVDAALDAGCAGAFAAAVEGGAVQVAYVPMMCARTPRSLALLDALEPVAAALLGGPVVPTRAKGVRYTGDTPAHVDSVRPVASVGVAAYLEPLDDTSGALRVLPGSHRAAPADWVSLPTTPGDVILFDEHLRHASAGGGVRRQWRADFVSDPRDDADGIAAVRAYFADIFPDGAPPPYDAALFPSYGPDWRASRRASVARLDALGVYALAAGR